MFHQSISSIYRCRVRFVMQTSGTMSCYLLNMPAKFQNLKLKLVGSLWTHHRVTRSWQDKSTWETINNWYVSWLDAFAKNIQFKLIVTGPSVAWTFILKLEPFEVLVDVCRPTWKWLSQCPCQMPNLSLAVCSSGPRPACRVRVSCPDGVAAFGVAVLWTHHQVTRSWPDAST